MSRNNRAKQYKTSREKELKHAKTPLNRDPGIYPSRCEKAAFYLEEKFWLKRVKTSHNQP